MKKKNKKKYMFVILLLLVVGISIGYAALTTTLNINGTTIIEKSTWDIHFENLIKTKGSETATVEAAIDPTKTLIEYTVTLPEPGDYYEFTTDIVNAGTIDGMISEVLKTGVTASQEEYIDYTVNYTSGVPLQEKDILKAQEKENIKVRVKYRDDIDASDLPTEDVTLTLTFQVTYIQADEAAEEIPACYVNSGDGTNIGDEITCGTESFYVISSTTDEIKMLAKYNLNVGDYLYTESTEGLQHEKVIGYFEPSMTNRYGVLAFSSSAYWSSITQFPAFIYDSNSNLYEYVEAYEKHLIEQIGVTSADATLLSYEQATALGCKETPLTCKDSKYPWVYSTSYWLGSATNTYSVWYIFSDGGFHNNSPLQPTQWGIRPVITISSNEI